LTTEVAADEHAVHHDLLFGYADCARHLRTQPERCLVRRNHPHRATWFDPHRARVRLDVALVVARRAERVLENPVSASKRCRPLAIGSDLHDQVPLDVRMRDGWPRSTELDVVLG